MKKIINDLFSLEEQVQFLVIGLNALLGVMTLITLFQEALYGSFIWAIIQFVLMTSALFCLDYLLWGLYN